MSVAEVVRLRSGRADVHGVPSFPERNAGGILRLYALSRWSQRGVFGDKVSVITSLSTRDVALTTHSEKSYSPPNAASVDKPLSRNILAICGLALACVSFLGLNLTSFSHIFVLSTFLAIPALVISLVAMCWHPRRAAAWGAGLAFLVCLYLPTMIFALR